MANLYVIYNGLVMGPPNDPSGLCGGGACDILTPFVTRSETIQHDGQKERRLTSLSIAGKIIGDDIGTINTKRNAILDAFSEDFKPLTAGRYTFDYVVVKEVTFSEGNVGAIDFSISLDSYDKFFQYAPVLEPKNEYSYEEGEDGVLTLRHTISCKGVPKMISSDSNFAAPTYGDERDGVAAARFFCVSLLGLPSVELRGQKKARWTSFSGAAWSTSHTVDRANGTYTIEEVWKQGKYSTSGFVEHYDISTKRSIDDDLPTVDINYSIKGPPTTGMSTLRSNAPTPAQLHAKIDGASYGGVIDDDENITVSGISRKPRTYEITEHGEQGKLEISASFDWLVLFANTYGIAVSGETWTAKNYYVSGDYTTLDTDISITRDEIKEITTVDINATMKMTRGSVYLRMETVNAWFASIDPSKFLFTIAANEYDRDYPTAGTPLNSESAYWPLNPWHKSLAIEKDDKTGEIKMTASFDNRPSYYSLISTLNADAAAVGRAIVVPGETYFHWRNLSFDINQKGAIGVMSLKAGQNGTSFDPDYLVFNHNTLAKETTTINVQGEIEQHINGTWYHDDPLARGAPDIALGGFMADLEANTLQAPLASANALGIGRVLESHDSSKDRKGAAGIIGQVGSTLSKSLSISQVVSTPIIAQDGVGVFGLGPR